MPLARAASADFGRGWGCWAVTEWGRRECGSGGGGLAVTELCIVHKSNAGGESDNSGGGGRQADRCRLGIINRYTNIRKTYGE